MTTDYSGDSNIWDNLNAAHFEKEFYRETYSYVLDIIKGKVNGRYFDKPHFFDRTREGYEEDKLRPFHVENGLKLMEDFVARGEILWLNLLDKLYAYAPDNLQVQQYMQIISEEGYLN